MQPIFLANFIFCLLVGTVSHCKWPRTLRPQDSTHVLNKLGYPRWRPRAGCIRIFFLVFKVVPRCKVGQMCLPFTCFLHSYWGFLTKFNVKTRTIISAFFAKMSSTTSSILCNLSKPIGLAIRATILLPVFRQKMVLKFQLSHRFFEREGVAKNYKIAFLFKPIAFKIVTCGGQWT